MFPDNTVFLHFFGSMCIAWSYHMGANTIILLVASTKDMGLHRAQLHNLCFPPHVHVFQLLDDNLHFTTWCKSITIPSSVPTSYTINLCCHNMCALWHWRLQYEQCSASITIPSPAPTSYTICHPTAYICSDTTWHCDGWQDDTSLKTRLLKNEQACKPQRYACSKLCRPTHCCGG